MIHITHWIHDDLYTKTYCGILVKISESVEQWNEKATCKKCKKKIPSF